MKIMQSAAILLAVAGLALSQPAFAKSVPKRQHNQEKRIKQGVKSGQLTKTEAKQLQGEHKAIHQEAKADRAANGGKLSKADRQKIKKEQNGVSKDIYTDKHNAETQPGVAPATGK